MRRKHRGPETIYELSLYPDRWVVGWQGLCWWWINKSGSWSTALFVFITGEERLFQNSRKHDHLETIKSIVINRLPSFFTLDLSLWACECLSAVLGFCLSSQPWLIAFNLTSLILRPSHLVFFWALSAEVEAGKQKLEVGKQWILLVCYLTPQCSGDKNPRKRRQFVSRGGQQSVTVCYWLAQSPRDFEPTSGF